MRLPVMDSNCDTMKFNLKFKKKKKEEKVDQPLDADIPEEKTDGQTETETEMETDSMEEADTVSDDISPKEETVSNDIPPKPENTDKPKKKGKKKRKLFNPLSKLIYWFWGAGPPTKFNCKENPFGAYSLRGRLKRWFYVNYRGYCYSITTIYDKPNDVYLYDKDLIKRSELSEDSVHVTNEKNTNHLDLDHPKRGFDATKDYGFTAHDAYMYIRCNKIDEAMKIDLNEQSPVDYKKLLFIVIGVFVAFIVFYFMYMQR